MAELLVGSIFASTDDLMQKWLDLQLRYLRATTPSFDHVSFITNCHSNTYFTERTRVISGPLGADVDSQSHIRGLRQLLSYFQEHANHYEYFLFLDMDAFPIRIDWLTLLKKLIPSKYDVAIPIRFENLETRLHASIVFCHRKALSNLDFNLVSVGSDLLGEDEKDVGIRNYQIRYRDKVFPLLRSNRYNIHPLLFGIYYDIFYHNGCGTGRRFNMRGRTYWSHVAPSEINVMSHINELFSRPDSFINGLAGYNHETYAKV